MTNETKATLPPEVDENLKQQAKGASSRCDSRGLQWWDTWFLSELRAAALVAVEGMAGKNHPLANVYKCQGKLCQAAWIKRPIGQEEINANEAVNNGWEHDGEKWLCTHCTGRHEVSEAQIELLRDENERLQAELAALRVPVGPVTEREVEELMHVYRFTSAVEDRNGSRPDRVAAAAEIDKLITPRVAQAVEAEREKTALKFSEDNMSVAICNGCGKDLLDKNLWMEDGCPCNTARGVNGEETYIALRLRQEIKNERERHAAERAAQKKMAEDTHDRRAIADRAAHKQYIFSLKAAHNTAMIEADQRWQERLKAVEGDVLAQNDMARIRQMQIDEKYWKAKLSNFVSKSYEHCQKLCQDKLYEHVAKQDFHGAAGCRSCVEAIKEIRQLDAKPQEAAQLSDNKPSVAQVSPKFPECECGLPEQALCERCHQYGTLCECKVEAHDAWPSVLKCPNCGFDEPECKCVRAAMCGQFAEYGPVLSQRRPFTIEVTL